MTAEATILRELKLLREDVAKLKQGLYRQEKDKEQWVTAVTLKKRFDVDRRELAKLRSAQVIKFKVVKKGVVRYLLSSAEHFFQTLKK